MKLLFIDSCLKDDSRTLKLTNEIIKLFKNEYEIERIKTYEIPFKPIDFKIIEKRDNGIYDNLALKYAKKIKEADRIIISAPLWDMSYPSYLKLFLENVMLPNYLFKYIDNGQVGLVNAKKLLYVSTSGGTIDKNYGFDEIKGIANLWGIKDVLEIYINKLDIFSNDYFENELNKILLQYKKELEEF